MIQSTPFEGIMMIEPDPLPQADDVLIGYRLVRFSSENGVFMRPRHCSDTVVRPTAPGKK